MGAAVVARAHDIHARITEPPKPAPKRARPVGNRRTPPLPRPARAPRVVRPVVRPHLPPAPHLRAPGVPQRRHRAPGPSLNSPTSHSAPTFPGTSAQFNAQYGNTAANTVLATTVGTAIGGRFPGSWNPATPNIYNCRTQRGTGSCSSCYSVHSVAGAVDTWPTAHASAADIVAFAITLPSVQGAWLDASPGDVHVQIVPNPPAGWVPPCAGGSGGGGTVNAPAGAIVAARALQSAGCPRGQAIDFVAIAARESSWNPTSHTYGAGCGPGQCGRPAGPGRVCEDSWGLWQINWCAHEQTLRDRGITRPQLVVPTINAKAAGLISGGFSDLGPWRGLENVTDTEKQQAANAVAIVYGGATQGNTGHGHGTGSTRSSFQVPADIAPPKNCAEATQRKAASGGPVPATSAPCGSGSRTVTIPGGDKVCCPGGSVFDLANFTQTGVRQCIGGSVPAAVLLPHVGSLCSIPVFGSVSCGIAGFLSHLPAYLKITAGGVVMIGGLALIVAGATGNTSGVSQQAAAIVVKAPGVRGAVERRRAIGTVRTEARASQAAEEARSRVVTNARGHVRVTSRAAGAEARRADAEYRGTKGARGRERLMALRAEGRKRRA